MDEFKEYLSEKCSTSTGWFDELNTYEKISLISAKALQRLGIEEDKSVLITHFAKKYLWEIKKFRLKYKILNDPLHGTIKLHPVAVKIIDTEQFQRLRSLKQLETVEYVYPGARHSRFEHSIGTYHLAGRVMDHLNNNQPELDIEEKDKLCVQMAALCLDLGHAPFSLIYQEAMNRRDPNCGWTHERVSQELFQDIYDSDKTFFCKTWGIEKPDVDFIKTLIMPEEEQMKASGKPLYLFDVVNNKKSGLDVDKFDYMARDSLHLGIKSKFDYTRLIPFMRVIDDDICIRDKEINVLADLFTSRYDLHSKAYQHPVSVGVALMLTEAFEKLDNLQKYAGETDDSIFTEIMSLPDHEESKRLIKSVRLRKLWKYVGLVRLTDDDITHRNPLSHQAVESEMKAKMPLDLIDKLKVTVSVTNFASNRHNPFREVRYYTNDVPDKAFTKPEFHVKRDIPHTKLFDKVVFVFSKDRDENKILRIYGAFNIWCDENGLPSPYKT